MPRPGRFFAGRQQHARRLCARARPPSPFSGASPLKPALEPARRLLNAGLEQIGSPVRLSVDGGDAAAALAKDAPRVDPRPPLEPVVPLELIEAYVDDVLATDSVVNNALLPDTLERPAYVLVVQVVLHLLQECLGYLDGSRFFRRALTVQQSHSSVAALKHSGLALDAAMIEAIAARTSSSQVAPIISQRVDHALYVSCVRFALRLAADMLASGRLVSLLGLEVAHAPKGAPPTNAGWDDAFLEQRFGSMVDRLLQKRDINLAMVPDHLERELYLNVVRLLLNIATTALSSHDGAGGTQVDIFGVSARFSLE